MSLLLNRGCSPQFLLAVVLSALLPALARADAPEIPLVGRPADLPFSGASAPFAQSSAGEYCVPFQVSAAASPTRLEALTPLTLTVTITAVGRVVRPPERIDLHEAPGFDEAFFIEDVTDGKQEQVAPARWRWVYRLKPRGPETTAAPGVPFVFYNPDLRPAEKAFQILFTEPIPLTVEPPEPIGTGIELAAPLLGAADGPEVLRRPTGGGLPGPAMLVVLGVVPPLACLCWYQLWRRAHPDAAQRARLRRSTAARIALRALVAAAKHPGSEEAEQVAVAVAAYLRQRFDHGPAEWTPSEAIEELLARGCPLELAEQAAVLFRACADARFMPAPVVPSDLAGKARAFILAVEEST